MRFALAALAFLTACDAVVPEEVAVRVGLDDPCLTAFPECRDDVHSCVRADGVSRPDCKVGCLGASALVCRPEGPLCVQRVGPSDDPTELLVPVLCLTR